MIEVLGGWGGRGRRTDDTTRSPTTISPAVGSTKPAIRRNVVVLPQPEGPSRQTSSPCSMRSDTSSTTAVLSYRFVKFRSSTDATQSLLAPPPQALRWERGRPARSLFGGRDARAPRNGVTCR